MESLLPEGNHHPAVARLPSGADLLPEPSDPSYGLEFAAYNERVNYLAVKQGLPAIGSKMLNAHGIEWLVDGHTYARSSATLGRSSQLEDPCDLYPVSVPQNLSPRLAELLAEINRCTPKVVVPLDTVPDLRREYAVPRGHCVDALSDPGRILLFLDAGRLHEDALAHELGHVWIELVEGIEDYRCLKDLQETVRYGQVQRLQSFVLDLCVNQVLRSKGFELARIEEDRSVALGQLLTAVQAGYRPETRWESVFMATFLAEVLLDSIDSSDLAGGGLARIGECLSEEWQLAQDLESVIRTSPPIDRESAVSAIDRVLTLCFAFAGEHIDLEADLLLIEPELSWRDKTPEWLAGLTAQQKCEVGRLMARVGVGSDAEVLLESVPNGASARFRVEGHEWTAPYPLRFTLPMPYRGLPKNDPAIRLNEQNRRRQMEMTTPRIPAAPKLPSPTTSFPGRRGYSTGEARFITQVRMEQYLQGESPYGYANSNPTSYIDPEGDKPRKPKYPRIQYPSGRYGDCLSKAIKSYCQDINLSMFDLYGVISCIIEVESGWSMQPTHITKGSQAGSYALGPMQITPVVGELCIEWGFDDWKTNPCTNIKCGVKNFCNTMRESQTKLAAKGDPRSAAIGINPRGSYTPPWIHGPLCQGQQNAIYTPKGAFDDCLMKWFGIRID